MPALRWATWPGSTVPWQPSAAYFGFAVALNILFTGMLEIFVSSPWMAKIGRWFMELKGDTGGHLLMWLLILGIAVLGAGFFVLTRYLLKNHLNLE